MDSFTMDTQNISPLQRNSQPGAARKGKTYDMTYIAVATVLIAICSWISIPALVPFTLQTFAIFLSVLVLGGRRGTIAVLLYLLLGLIGVPVFAGFSAGPHVLFGTTGGYLIGFILSALIMWLMESLFLKKLSGKPAVIVQAISIALGMFAYYLVGTIWFMMVYMRSTGPIGLATVLGWCVIPFLIPDIAKSALALILANMLRKPLSRIMS